jgi:Asp-tRNA(Asn)/Glu-tRNA(Gln) amidotransferase A subunit family amidase
MEDRDGGAQPDEVPITADMVAGAERLMGARYTDAERALMLDNIAEQIELARRRRAVTLPATLPPATRFDPRLPGWRQLDPGIFRPSDGPAPPLPDSEADIAYAPLHTLARWIRDGLLTSTRLTEIYLARIERLNPLLHCFATVTPELALEQAREADALLAGGTYLGPLHGVPWGCKDILDTAGIITAWGAEPWRDRAPESNATVVRRLRNAGAVLLGKTTVGALAYGDTWYGGQTRNPWNLDEGSSGSSAGSASATAAGLVGFSLGTETLGSIVAPSIRCGTTGLRPTFGRVPRTGAMPLCWTLDKIGPICREVEDTALVLSAISGADEADPFSIAASLGFDFTRPVSGMRVGYYEEDFETEGAHELDRAALGVMRGLGVELVALERPKLPYETLMNILRAEAAASFEELTLHVQDDALTWQEPPAWPNSFRKARFLSAVDHVQLDRLRHRVMQEMQAALLGVEAMIGPALAGPMLIITNFTGHPCLVLRSGFHQTETRWKRPVTVEGTGREGTLHTVPHGICLWGRLFDEGTILRLGVALERALDVAQERPLVG